MSEYTNTISNDTSFKIGSYTIKPQEYSIQTPELVVKVIQPKFIELLAYLAQNYPRVVERHELIDVIWDGNNYVGEKALTNAIWNLRNELKALNTTAIETIRKKGYRLLIAPEYIAEEENHLQLVIKNNKFTTPIAKISALAIAVIVLAILFSYFLPESPKNSVKITKVTSDPGREVYPVISPDNHYLVYSWRRIGKQPNLFLRDLTKLATKAKQLTFSEDYESKVVWHPSGKEIFFQRKSWDYSKCTIVSLNLITNSQNILAPCSGELDFALAIAPDGKYLAYIYQNTESKEQTVHLIDLDGNRQENTVTIPLYTCNKNCIYKDLDVDFSPDGLHLVIARTLDEGFNEDLFLFNLQNKKFTQLTDTEGDIKGLAWHPNNKNIIYSAQFFGKRDGYIYSLKDKTTTQLNIPGFSYPKFIPNSHNIIYHQWQVLSQISSISLKEKNATSPFPLLKSDYSYNSAHYNPVTNRIVFVSNESGYDEIWTSKTDGSDRIQLTSLKSHLTFPRWSHNGEYIAFLAPKNKNNKNSLYIYNVKSKIGKKIASDFEQHYRPSWLQDDSALLAGASKFNTTALYAFPINDAVPYLIMNSQVTYAEQDKDMSIWFTPARNKGLWRFEPNSKKLEKILSEQHFRVKYNWELSEEGIFFQQDYADHLQINLYKVNTKDITTVVKMPIGTILRTASLSYIPKESKLIFSQQDFPKIDIKKLSHPLL